MKLHARKSKTKNGIRYRYNQKGCRIDLTIEDMKRAKTLVMTTTEKITSEDKKSIKKVWGSKVQFV